MCSAHIAAVDSKCCFLLVEVDLHTLPKELKNTEKIVVAAVGYMQNGAKQERSSAETYRNRSHPGRRDDLIVCGTDKVLPRSICTVGGKEVAVSCDVGRSSGIEDPVR
jgi:hypothetical protein